MRSPKRIPHSKNSSESKRTRFAACLPFSLPPDENDTAKEDDDPTSRRTIVVAGTAILAGIPDDGASSVHDFQLFKGTVRALVWGILLLAESGYQGLLAWHQNSRIPYKKSKNHPLSAEQKRFNRALSKERIVIENINARIKTFKILSERYRNRRKRTPVENELTLCYTQSRTATIVAEHV